MFPTGDYWNGFKKCIACGLVVTCIHLEHATHERNLHNTPTYLPPIAAGDHAPHSHSEEYATNTPMQPYAVEASGGTLSFMQRELFEQQKDGKIPIFVDGMKLICHGAG